MKKKDIKKLNDAMLENIEVPDSVLDMARGEMRTAAPAPVSAPAKKVKGTRFRGAKGGAVAINRGAVAAVCSCAALAVAVAVVLFIWFNGFYSVNDSNDGGSYYDVSMLTSEDITSVSQYNSDNGTAYLCPEGLTNSTVLYSSSGFPVLFVESFTYGGTDCTWYVVVDQNDYFDLLENFGYTLTLETEINGCTVYYKTTENCQYAELYYGPSRYCLSVESQDTQTLFEILEYILG